MDSSNLLTQSAGYNIVDIINMGIALAFIVAALLSIFYIFYGGISFILAAGREEKIKEAVHMIRYAIIGLIVTFLAVTIIAMIGNLFGFNLVSYITWDKIYEMIQGILASVSNQGGKFIPGKGTLQ